ncbi:tetratricopeptide repeat protein [Massilia jejuensis]|uniref:Tetratricopeptide repeat protein n=1 Tax=Massilia jejuensis TaxID=648894 RepID=A0ABW0PB15_9BURK
MKNKQTPADRLFAAGLAAHRKGQLAAAFAQYEAALQRDARHFDTLHHIGILGYQNGDHELALQFISEAISVNPGVASVYSNLGNIFKAIGEHASALQSYGQALALSPGNVDALYNRGNVLEHLRRYDEALASYRRALELAPRDVAAWTNLAAVLLRLERHDEALASCERALALAPAHAQAMVNLGNILVAQGRHEEALAAYDRARTRHPGHLEARINHAKALRMLSRFDDALAAYDTILAAAPDAAEAWHGRANVLRHLRRRAEALGNYQQAVVLDAQAPVLRVSLGHLLIELGKLDGALKCFDIALALDAALPSALNGRGIVLQRLRRLDEAMACFERAVDIDPDFTDSLLNRANVLQDLGRSEEALAAYDAVLAQTGDSAATWNNRGNVYEAMLRYEDALACFDKAIAIQPGYAPPHWNRALLNLQHGNLRDGWRGYEWRWNNEVLSCYAEKRTTPEPVWDGRDALEGKTILLYAEQGLGDTLQFCRYAALVKARGARVVLEVQAPLRALLAKLEGADLVVAKGEPLPAVDYQCPLMSLPLAFGTELHSIPAPHAYLASDDTRLAQWEARLGARVRPRVGLVWSGNAQHANDHNRSLPFAQLARLFDLDCQFVSLQKEYRDADRALLDASPVLRMDTYLNDFADTAALCRQMDLVIAVDTSVAHLAGALGKPLWLLLPQVADWRWLTVRDDSPWYATARLFRQPAKADWNGVIDAVRSELEALARA